MKGIFIAVVLFGCSGEVQPMNEDGSTSGGDGGGGTADVPGGIGEPANLVGMTLYHNEVRAAVDTSGIAAGPLPPMQWDPDLAAYAAQWAAMCRDMDPPAGLIDHNPARSNVAGYAYIGENIYGSSGTATARAAVDAWKSEKANFTYPTSCNGTCGHYTQIVWRTSVNVGCALATCASLQYKSVVVCDYGPGGNSGGAPY